jgi:glycyl-radical enzyme activating protein
VSESPSPRTAGTIFDLDTFAVHDGPGIRMAVYFKGCPLHCRWCHSPESQSPDPQLVWARGRCTQCGRCVALCAQGVHTLSDGRHAVDFARCRVCGACVGACPPRALQIKGRRVTAGEIIARAQRMAPFFRNSGGGVTLTGGEATAQADFALAILQGCQNAGIHTALETSGACSWETLEPLVERCDLVLYDLKLADEEQHRRWTGVGNARILANARRLVGRAVRVRVALIPGITDTDHNLRGLLRFVADAGLRDLEFLPLNPATAAKYEWLGRACDLPPTDAPPRLDHARDLAASFGLQVIS